MGDYEVFFGLVIGLLGIAASVFFGLRNLGSGFSTKLSNIEKNTEPIGQIKDTTIRLDERINFLLSSAKGTAEGALKNLGKVSVIAEPSEKKTIYRIHVEKPVLKSEFLDKLSKESGFEKKEIALFGEPSRGTAITPNDMIVHVPCTDPEICSNFITQLLKWLDSEYWTALGKVKDYEKITF